MSEVARENLKKAANACRRYGWISFWTQLVLTTIAAVILLFSMAFTAQVKAFGGFVALSQLVVKVNALRPGAARNAYQSVS